MPRPEQKVSPHKALVLSPDKQIYACPVIRLLVPLQHIGWEIIWAGNVETHEVIDKISREDVDLIIIQRHFPSQETESAIRAISALSIPILMDLDDDFLATPASHPQYDYLASRVPFIKWMLKEADLVTVSTEALKETITKLTGRPVLVLPNLIAWDLFDAKPRRAIDKFNLIVSGTPTHQSDWSIIEKPIKDILSKYQQRVSVTFFGELPPYLADHPAAKALPFQPGYIQYAEKLKQLDIHAALVPLEDTQFNHSKSNIKWLEYSAAGICGIYSDLEPYNTSIINKETGFLVKNTPEAWFNAIDGLINGPDTAIHMANNARRTIYTNHSIQAQAGLYSAAYNAILGQEHRNYPFSSLQLVRPHMKARATKHLTQIKRGFHKYISWRFSQH